MKVKCYFFRFWDALWLIEINVVESWQRNKHRKPFLLSFEHSCLVQLSTAIWFLTLEIVKKFFSKHLNIFNLGKSQKFFFLQTSEHLNIWWKQPSGIEPLLITGVIRRRELAQLDPNKYKITIQEQKLNTNTIQMRLLNVSFIRRRRSP